MMENADMSAELMVWRADGPVSREAAAAKYRGVQGARAEGPDGSLGLLAESREPSLVALAEQLPGLVTVHDGYAMVVMEPEEMDEVSNQVFTLAAGLALTVYDPQRDLVHNTGPLGVNPAMQLHTGDGMIVTNPDLGLVHDVLGTLSPQNPFVALVTFGSHFIQVSPGYELEYKEGAIRRTMVEDLADIRRAFHEYALGERAFLERLDWS